MKDIIFVSEKPYSEVEKEFENVDFFSGIMDGLQEALSYEQGKARAETFVRKRTVESWETGRSTPSPTSYQ